MTGRSGGKRTQARPRGYLAERRKAVGLDQETLARRLGVHKATVMRWERGSAEPQPSLRPKLAAVLGISYDTLADLLAGPHSAAGAMPQRLEDLRVALVGYLDADGSRQERVDITDVRGPVTVASLTTADARAFAEQIAQATGRVYPRYR